MIIMVTGGNGYIGSHCVISLLNAGYNVLIFDNCSTGHIGISNTISKIKTSGKFLGTISGDLLNVNDINKAFDKYDIGAVIHFAAFSQVAEPVKNPNKYYRNNICGTINLLDSMKNHSIDKIVFSSTAAIYGEPQKIPIDESHPKNPINPYGKTKLAIEEMMDDYDNAYNIRSVRLRYFNVAGADSNCRVGEWHNPETHLIPNILKSTFDKSKCFELFGDDYDTRDGTCIRDYVNVEDLADAHILALEYLINGGKTDFFNLGTNEGSSVKEIFTECEKITGKKIPIIVKERRSGDPAILIADNKKAKEILHWNPHHTLEDSIRTAYLWELKIHNG